MDCLRSFSFGINQINTITGAPDLKQWATGTAQHFWQVNTGTSSTYNFEGFKRLDIYGIDILGSIQTQANIAINGVIVNDWSIDVQVGGQSPLVGATVTGVPNYYALDVNLAENSIYPLGRFNPSIKFESPISGSTFIQIQKTRASGIAYETIGSVNLWTRLNFIVYYKFEGE
jgi:hypothetical protein